MGFWFLESWGTEDQAIIKEIARVHKADLKKVAKAYENMLTELEYDEVEE
jgi:hypothetical protein